MGVRVNPNLIKDLEKFGVQDSKKCFNCGNCTAVCPLSTEETTFPRKVIRYLQLGLEENLIKSPEPWLCYYCGECSTTCPRGADPGEAMMGLRRYLTSKYDWTGFSRKFYTSEAFEIISISIVALLVGLAFYLFHGEVITDRVALNTFADNHVIEIADLIMGGILSIILLSNVFRMATFILGDKLFKIPISVYIGEMKNLILHTMTQKKFAECEDRFQWIIHLLIMTGYASVFFLVVVCIRWFQRDEILPFFHPIRLIGYYSTCAILYGTTYAMIGRLKKVKPVYKNSHPTDWMFLILLWLTTFSGILIHFARLLEMPLPTYVIYVIHMMIAVPMLVLEVPFAKWAHLAYRPMVIFLTNTRAKAKKIGAITD